MTQTIAPAAQTWRHTAPGTMTGPAGWTVVNTNSSGYPWIVVRPDGTPVGPGAGTGYMSAESAQWAAVNTHGARETAPVLAAGTIVHITNPYDAEYIGEVVESFPGSVVLRNYSAWYEGNDVPFNSHYDDEVQVGIDHDTLVDIQD